MIKEFRGEYRFLSNFYPSRIVFEGISYPTVEHAFQAAKIHNAQERLKISLMAKPGDAKRYGRKVELRADWEQVKVRIMKLLVKEKFRCYPDLFDKLMDTKDEILIEGNTWHDNFWGQCVCHTCSNERDFLESNFLGKTLMEVRTELRSE